MRRLTFDDDGGKRHGMEIEAPSLTPHHESDKMQSKISTVIRVMKSIF